MEPNNLVELPRLRQPDQRYLSAEQVARLADAMSNAGKRTLVFVLAYGGLRWGEMAALHRGRVDVLRRQMGIKEAFTGISGRLSLGSPKTHGVRVVHLPPFATETLGVHLQSIQNNDDGLVAHLRHNMHVSDESRRR
ncbi:MAG: hypothetical protein GY788_02535 [bacterium]|nr:hypothetical protein [bacterium]